MHQTGPTYGPAGCPWRTTWTSICDSHREMISRFLPGAQATDKQAERPHRRMTRGLQHCLHSSEHLRTPLTLRSKPATCSVGGCGLKWRKSWPNSIPLRNSVGRRIGQGRDLIRMASDGKVRHLRFPATRDGRQPRDSRLWVTAASPDDDRSASVAELDGWEPECLQIQPERAC